jgi:hypothetical protein
MADSTLSERDWTAPQFIGTPFQEELAKTYDVQAPGHAVMTFAAQTEAIAGGVQLVLNILHDETLRGERRTPADFTPEDRPLMSVHDFGVLQNFALHSLSLLQRRAEEMGVMVERQSRTSRTATAM